MYSTIHAGIIEPIQRAGRGVTATYTIRVRVTPGSNPGAPTGENATMPTHPSPQQYPPETAGRLMLDRSSVPYVQKGTTLPRLRELLDAKSSTYETINYIYVVDAKSRLKGVISIKEFYEHQHEHLRVDDIMAHDVLSIRAHTHQERAALLALKHNLKAVPVVDQNDTFLGVIPSDTILKVLDKETVEDILHFGGIYHKGSFDDLLTLSTFQSIKHRIPWLLIGLSGGVMAAGIINGFKETLSQNIILAAFIPLIVYMADAVGTQTEAFIIRDLAVNPGLNFTKYFFKQVSVVLLIGIISSIILSLFTYVIYGNGSVSIVLAIALFVAIVSSVLTGMLVPYIFVKIKLDPANAAGPIATIIQDVLSVLVYFIIASVML